uniref:DUF4537 domain-containing protein n=1 Tax=Meleagris gallopavo TaxID=9103 RepID=A0A803YE46_MELGA
MLPASSRAKGRGFCLKAKYKRSRFSVISSWCCSMMPALDKFLCSSAIPAIHPCCRSSFTMHPAWITKTLAPLWCQRIGRCLPSLGPAWPRLSMSQRSAILAKNVPVLVRGEHDGFYYHGTVKEEMENEREMFLVEFTRPLQLHGRHSVCVQKTAKDDILEYANGMKHSLLPGDKVLAPWEPDLVRYGPGTILTGIETRDPLRGTGRRSSICTKGKLESKAISVVDMSHVAPPEQNAVLETTEQPPRGQFTMNEKYQDFKLSSGEEGSVASGKQRYRGTRKKTESDNKHKATCLGKDKLGSTDCISREQRGKEQQSSC